MPVREHIWQPPADSIHIVCNHASRALLTNRLQRGFHILYSVRIAVYERAQNGVQTDALQMRCPEFSEYVWRSTVTKWPNCLDDPCLNVKINGSRRQLVPFFSHRRSAICNQRPTVNANT